MIQNSLFLPILRIHISAELVWLIGIKALLLRWVLNVNNVLFIFLNYLLILTLRFLNFVILIHNSFNIIIDIELFVIILNPWLKPSYFSIFCVNDLLVFFI